MMRVIAIVIGFVLLTLGVYAQQERQMKKPGAAQATTPGAHGQVDNIPSAPRQMMRSDNKVVTTNNSATNGQASDKKREMVLLNPNLTVKKKN